MGITGLGDEENRYKGPLSSCHIQGASCQFMAADAGLDHVAELCSAGFSAVKSPPSLPSCALGVEVLTHSLHVAGRMST